MFVCSEYHGTLTEDSHGSIWGNMEGLSSKAAISIAVESPVHFDQVELQDENATNTFSEGQCMLVQSSLAHGLSARENRGILGLCHIDTARGFVKNEGPLEYYQSAPRT